MRVKGILVEGSDGHEYLLGIGPRPTGKQKERPTIWRLTDGEFTPLEPTKEGSVTIREQLEMPVPRGWNRLPSGWSHDEYVKLAVLEAMGRFLHTFFGAARW